MAFVGIDLGTTNSLIAVYDGTGARLLPNALGEVMTPSAVGLADDGKTLLVGKAARLRLLRHPLLTAARFKRLMGTDKVVRLGRRSFTATDLSAALLAQLRRDAEAALGEPVSDVVISVPAYFNARQRQATKDAAEIAGLRVSRLINEPTAAALAAGVNDRDDESLFVVLDLGGGTFDVSILEMFEGVMEVRASSGDAFLGGEDFTAAIARDLARQTGHEWAGLGDAAREKLLVTAEDFKRRLSSDTGAAVEAVIDLDGAEHRLSFSAAQFETATSDLVTRLRRPIEASLYDSGIDIDRIDRVLLVGGATRMPVIRSLVARIFRKLPERRVDPDHAIALGAAVQAALIGRHEGLRDVVLTDVAPFSMGIMSHNNIAGRQIADAFTPLIERGTILPASRNGYFSTTADGQKMIAVEIFQGEAAFAADNIHLGSMKVPVPPGPAGKEGIEVRFTYDVSGLLAVDVTVQSSGQVHSDLIENLAEALPPAEKARRLKEME
ncbi:MAG: Hsp70 family protein, partial [Paracoccus sp. (in: a-proteobacteria)]|nr:Hsp70 family protein [Paracoccus sp. (in: a-proteobacteria)]